MTAERKTGENLYKHMRKAIVYIVDELGIDLVGVTGDAGPDEKKARRLALRDFPQLLIADCWAHQVLFLLLWG
jgi:hypothetical protein